MPVLYHNPKCSKSRETLALLRERGVEPKVVDYMATGLSAAQLKTLVKQLGFDSPRALMRTKEAEYKDLGLADIDDAKVLLQAMAEHPRLIERPILVNDDKAALGRPPENVFTIL